MSGLSRALSWPLLNANGCLPQLPGPDEDDGTRQSASPPATPSLVASKLGALGAKVKGAGGPGPGVQQARRLLCRHYYPEGGWGWVVVFCCASVHLLVGGLQLSWAVLLAPTARKFDVLPLHTGRLTEIRSGGRCKCLAALGCPWPHGCSSARRIKEAAARAWVRRMTRIRAKGKASFYDDAVTRRRLWSGWGQGALRSAVGVEKGGGGRQNKGRSDGVKALAESEWRAAEG